MADVQQRFFYNFAREFTDVDQKQSSILTPDSLGAILDGWLVEAEYLIQPYTATTGANGIGIMGFSIRQAPLKSSLYDVSNYSSLYENYLADSNEASFFHGSQNDMDDFYLLYTDVTMDDGQWTKIKKIFRKVINAGGLLYDEEDNHQLSGTGFTFGTARFQASLKQVVSCKKINPQMKQRGPMKFVGTMVPLNSTVERMTIAPPCKGYYTNVSLQMYHPELAQIENKVDYIIGINQPDISTMPLDPVVGEEKYMWDIVPNGLRVTIHENVMLNELIVAQKVIFWKHFGNKKLYVNNDDDVLSLQVMCDTSMTGGFLIQGNFVPRQGTYFKHYNDYGAVIEATNWTLLHRQQIALAECNFQFQLQVTRGVDEFTGTVYIRRHKANLPIIVDTITTAEGIGDIIDEDIMDSKSHSLMGVIAAIDFDTEGLQAASEVKDVVLPVPIAFMGEGDFLSADVKVKSGTLNGTLNLSAHWGGTITQKFWCENADFLEGSAIVPIDSLGQPTVGGTK